VNGKYFPNKQRVRALVWHETNEPMKLYLH